MLGYILIGLLLLYMITPKSKKQITKVEINDKVIMTLTRELNKPDHVQDMLHDAVFRSFEKRFPNIKEVLFYYAQRGVTVDSLLIALKLNSINGMENLDDKTINYIGLLYEYVCAKVSFS